MYATKMGLKIVDTAKIFGVFSGTENVINFFI